MGWKFNSDTSVSKQIATKLKLDILFGKYPAGSQFPTVRQIASIASVNPNTVQKALGYLEDDGLLIARGTVGRFVTEDNTVIKDMLEALQREYMQNILNDGLQLGITKEQFIEFLKEGNT